MQTQFRILATIASVDIVGSTEVVAALGDDLWSQHLDRFVDEAHRRIAAARGRCLEHAGDGLLIAFPSPTAAVRAMVELCRATDDVVGLKARAGVHLGEFLVGSDRLCGLALHLVARLQGAASPGETLVSEDAARFTDDSVVLAAPSLVELKGFSQPVAVCSARLAHHLAA